MDALMSLAMIGRSCQPVRSTANVPLDRLLRREESVQGGNNEPVMRTLVKHRRSTHRNRHLYANFVVARGGEVYN